MIAGERFINQALHRAFEGRSFDSIKSHRKSPAYKLLVSRFLEQLRQVDPPPIDQDPDGRVVEHVEDFRSRIIDFLGVLDPPAAGTPVEEQLVDICSQARHCSAIDLRSMLADFLDRRFPLPAQRVPAARQPSQGHTLSKRRERRRQYRRVQRNWSLNPVRAVHAVLGNIVDAPPLPENVMIPYWRQVFTRGNNNSPQLPPSTSPLSGLGDPITEEEVRANYVERNSSPGPDGVAAAELMRMDPNILVRLFNLVLLCDRPPDRLLESRTVFIPKKDDPREPSEFRPITVSSVITRCLHKILAQRLDRNIELDNRQRAFRRMDGCASNTYLLDLVLRSHRKKLRSVYVAVIDVSKAFDSVSHACIENVLNAKGIPSSLVTYIMATYRHGFTKLSSRTWHSDPITPTCGVKQGDPLSPIIFNMVMDNLLKILPNEIGAEVGSAKIAASLFADDIVLMASSARGLQSLIDTASAYLVSCGLSINIAKSQTISWKTVPHLKKIVVDEKQKFVCAGVAIPSLSRSSTWKYLGVTFNPEGRCKPETLSSLAETLTTLTKAPLKPQQRLFALRVVIVPGLLHQLALGWFTLSYLNRLDKQIRSFARKWLSLPADCPNAYFHAGVRDGGLGIPSLRWVIPQLRMRRLQKLPLDVQAAGATLQNEIADCTRRLNDRGALLDTPAKIARRWAEELYKSIDGGALKESSKVPQQHRWVQEGTKFLGGGDFVNSVKLRINALPTRSRGARGRDFDRRCRAGCEVPETLNHILQQCHRTHNPRVDRHNSAAKYLANKMRSKGYRVWEEPVLRTNEGLRKPDIVAELGGTALVVDAQIINDQYSADTAHQNKIAYYRPHEEHIKQLTGASSVHFGSCTITWRGVWSKKSADDLRSLGILMAGDMKVMSSRVLIGGWICYKIFNRSTLVRRGPPRSGVG